jgi:putative ABC transport system permease protein
MQFHLDQQIEENLASGMTPYEARCAALRTIGGVAQFEEECRDMRGVNLVENLLQDFRYALRSIAKSRGFAMIAVLTLALGIGASLAIVTVIKSVMLRPLPFPAADRLAVLFATNPARGLFRDTTSFPDFLDWKGQSHGFTYMAAWRSNQFNLTGAGTPKQIVGLRASYEVFSVLGVSPALGRGFDRKEQAGKVPVAILGRGLWRSRFGGSPDVLGKTVVLDDVPHTIIGVLPEGFQFPSFTDIDVVVPIPEYTDRSWGYLQAVARLRPGVRTIEAQQELDNIAQRLGQAFPSTNRGRGVNLVPLRLVAVGDVRTPLLVLMGAAAFVLLIGCANVGNLVLVRGIARRRELAVRSALGAAAWRLIRQVLTETSVVALLAAFLGTGIAIWGSKLLAISLSQQFALLPVIFDWPLLALAVLIGVLSGVLCGLPSALMVRRSHPNDALKQGNRGQAGSRHENRLQNVLVTCETALTVILIVGAGLLLKSFVLLQQTNLGLNPRNALMADLMLSKRYSDPERRATFLREILDSVGTLPGVQHVALHTDPPFLGGGSQESFHVEGVQDPSVQHGHIVAFNVVSNGFFAAMGIPITRGRAFDKGDTASALPVVVVNEAVARQFWPGADPIGKRIKLYYDKDPQHWLSVVGIAGDVRYRGRDLEPVSQVFVPYQQNPYERLPYAQSPDLSVVVRTTADPTNLIKAVQARIWAVDKDQPISAMQSMEQALSDSVANRRVYLVLLSVFAVIALFMATAGIYGLVSYAVARRTQEIGIRVALGATAGRVLALVIRQGMLLTLIGVAIGIVGSMVLTKMVSGLLYGITPTDARTFIETALLFGAVALIATYVPGRRAATIDPTVAFRYE